MQPTKKTKLKNIPPEQVNFITNIKNLRDAHNLKTQKQFADAIGVKLHRVNNWDRYHCFPNLQELLFIASFFGTSIEALSKKIHLQKAA